MDNDQPNKTPKKIKDPNKPKSSPMVSKMKKLKKSPGKNIINNPKHKKKKHKKFWVNMAVGGISAAFIKTFTAPLERVKLILQVSQIMKDFQQHEHIKPEYQKINTTLSNLYHNEGYKSFWRGNNINITRYFLAQALNFSFKYEYNKLTTMQIDPSVHFWRYSASNFISGALAGATSLVVVYPFDFIRTRLACDLIFVNKQRKYIGWEDCLMKIVAHDGFMGLYRGFGVSLGGIVMYRGIYFGGYDSVKLFFQPDEWVIKKYCYAQCVTLVAGYMTYPKDTVRRRLMLQSGEKIEDHVYRNGFHAFYKIFQEEGVKGYFRGALMNIYRGFGGSVALVMYDEIQDWMDKHYGESIGIYE